LRSAYPQRRLADLAARVDYGLTASATEDHGGPKFLRITDIVRDHLEWSSVPFCAPISDGDRARFGLAAGDIVIARTGATVGYSQRVKEAVDAVFASYLVRVRVTDECDATYVGYVVGSDDYKEFVRANAGGAAQPNANARVLTSYLVPLPSLTTQRKIAAILSAYDDLIENNNRRIELLEEMAQRIYREWFVEFRYPGHENVPLADSELGLVPEGWGVARVANLVERVRQGVVRRVPVDPIEDVVPIVDQSRDDIAGFHNGAPGVVASIDDPAIVFGDHTCKMQAMLEPFSVGPNVVVFRPSAPIPALLLIRILAGLVHTQEYKRHWTSLSAKLVVVPPLVLGEQFAVRVKENHALVRVLREANRRLRASRDLLLPRLMSGEIDVTDLDIAVPDFAA
jgi:type I restriction enzyme S subunit